MKLSGNYTCTYLHINYTNLYSDLICIWYAEGDWWMNINLHHPSHPLFYHSLGWDLQSVMAQEKGDYIRSKNKKVKRKKQGSPWYLLSLQPKKSNSWSKPLLPAKTLSCESPSGILILNLILRRYYSIILLPLTMSGALQQLLTQSPLSLSHLYLPYSILAESIPPTQAHLVHFFFFFEIKIFYFPKKKQP